MFTVYKVGELQVNWDGRATYNVYVNGENIACFTYFDAEDPREVVAQWLDENWQTQIANRIDA